MPTEVSSELSYLGYKQIVPSPGLRDYVECYWFIRTDYPLLVYREEFLYPKGGMGIIFNSGDELNFEGKYFAHQCFLDGTNTRTRRLGLWGKIEAVGIRFKPAGAYPFLSVPLIELKNENVLLDDLSVNAISGLYHQISESKSVDEKVDFIESWLMSCLKTNDVASAVKISLEMIRQQNGQISIKKMTDSLYISQRQLERLYQTQVGMSPKTYARLLRVENARKALKKTSVKSLADTGCVAGFYDQAHFIREFRSIVGMTPEKYRVRNSERSQSCFQTAT